MDQEKHVIVNVSVYDDWTEGANFAIINPNSFKIANDYMKELESMKERGMRPYRISEFNYLTTWLNKLPRISKELAAELDMVGQAEIESELEDAFDEGRPVVNTVEELCEWEDDSHGQTVTDCDTLNVTDSGFTFKTYIKQTQIVMETPRLGTEFNKPIPLLDCDVYCEDEIS